MIHHSVLLPESSDSSIGALGPVLFGKRRGPCVSIYLPAQSSSFTVMRRKLRFARLVEEAKRLVIEDHGEDFALEFFSGFWRRKPFRLIESETQALAFFHDASFSGEFRLGLDSTERTVVAGSFHVKPLLGRLQSIRRFHLISLSRRKATLYTGDQSGLKRTLEVLNPEFHEGDDEAQGGRLARPKKRDHRESLRRFFVKAEREIHSVVGRDRLPVILAGVGSLHSLYRKANRDPDLVFHAIRGNVERWSETQLRSAACSIIEELSLKNRERALRELKEMAGSGSTSADLGTVVQAALKGRVSRVVVSLDDLLFGRIDSRTGAVSLHPRQIDSQDDDVLDDLVELVLARGGQVFCVPAEEMPERSPVFALMKAS